MDSSSKLTQKAIEEARSGNKARAIKLLAQVVRNEPDNVQAWYMLSRLVEDKDQIIYCLSRVLKIEPHSPQAKARLKKLQSPPVTKIPIPTQGKSCSHDVGDLLRRLPKRSLTPAPLPDPASWIRGEGIDQIKKKPLKRMLLASSAGVIGTGLIVVLTLLGINALRPISLPKSVAISQAVKQEDLRVQPVLAFTWTPELLPTATMLPSKTPAATIYTTPSAEPTSTSKPMLAGAAACIPPEAQIETGMVRRVVDGDTIEVSLNGQAYPVRYIGIDSPEVSDPETGSSNFSLEAAAKNAELVTGKEITLVKDISEIDPYGRLLRYVFVGDLSGTFVNYELVAGGYAQASAYPPDVACAEAFQSAEEEARENGYGLWAAVPLLPSRSSGELNCDTAYPDTCIPPPPPDLDCPDIPFRRFRVLPPDPHNFDRDQDGIGCES